MWWTENRAKEKIENNVKTLLIKQRKLSGLPDLPQWFKNKTPDLYQAELCRPIE
jgi:hypothetical protein